MFTFNSFIESIKNTVNATINNNNFRLNPIERFVDLVNNIDENINGSTINTEPIVNETLNHTIIENEIVIIDNFNTRNAVIYIRVSTNEQEIDAQRYTCEQFCLQNNLNVLKIYIEKCSAFKNKSQPKLHKLIKENEKCNLIVFSIDRFSRNIKNADEFVKKLEQKNITLISIKENINLNTALGKHNFRNYINAAQYESELISERVKNSINYRKANNIHIGQAPYGYKIENKKLVKNTQELAIINFIISNFGRRKTSEELTRDLYVVLTALNRNQNEFEPISFILSDDSFEYKTYNTNEKLFISGRMLSDILLDYNIKKRNSVWNTPKIMRIVKTFPIYQFQNMKISKPRHNINAFQRNRM